ncbi:50S ribosomal protein L7ae [Candidatus Woesearchaeota archaeon]|nr:50S ribosomal protein L7ae [Candidatus Woesearchaeota archaeon]
MEENALEAIEAAKAAGKIKRGVNEVTKALERDIAKLVVVAKDVHPAEVIMHLAPLAKEKGVPFAEVTSKEELGIASGIHVPTAAVAVIKDVAKKEKSEEE